jgi:general secretion pathway protein J
MGAPPKGYPETRDARMGGPLMDARPMRDQRGFTLIEILLAVAILAIIMGMVYAAFDQTSRLAGHVDEVSEEYRAARLALARISDELMSTYVFEKDSTTRFVGEDGVGPDGQDADTLSFTSRSRAIPEGVPASAENALDYHLEGDRLMHVETLNPLGTGAGNVQSFPLAEGLAGFKLRYRNPSDGTWRDGWNPEAGVEGLPSAVEVTLLFPARGAAEDANRTGYLALTTVVPVPMGDG